MQNKKICISVDEKLYTAFQERYPHSIRQGVEELMRRSIGDDSFLWSFIHGLRTVIPSGSSANDMRTVISS